jgi:hypothetical protein
VLKIVSWNLNQQRRAWVSLLESGADLALVQEACAPPAEVASRISVDPAPWCTEGTGVTRPWRAAVVKLNPGLDVEWYEAKSISAAAPRELAVSRLGTLAAASVRNPATGERLVLVSMYSCWERPHHSTGSGWIYADASAHRLVSDLSAFVGQQQGHRLIAAGDLNILHGYGEHGSWYWAQRYQSVFDRMKTLGLEFIGPQAPDGRQSDPWPEELPSESGNVPTFHTNRQLPAAATRQLDFVFASADIARRVRVRALNEPGAWGPSDHCRVAIEVLDPSPTRR